MTITPTSYDNSQVGILDTSIASLNTGDFIIMDAAMKVIGECLPCSHTWRLATHEKLSWTSFKLQKRLTFNIACGSNLLHSNMFLIRQWNIGLIPSFFLKPVVMLGVGWRGRAELQTSFYTRRLLRSLLSSELLHSVRDSYTESRLHDIGISNVVNTACPTMWTLTPEHCREIPSEKGESVVMTLTDYSSDVNADRQLLQVLKRNYKKVYLWCQGSGDLAYFLSFGSLEDVQIVPPSLMAYDALLSNKTLSLDYVGTRLHGGIRALQHQRRTLIIGVDHRAREKGNDFNLPVTRRYGSMEDLHDTVRKPFSCDIQLPLENIRKWKQQFAIPHEESVTAGSSEPLETTFPFPNGRQVLISNSQ